MALAVGNLLDTGCEKHRINPIFQACAKFGDSS